MTIISAAAGHFGRSTPYFRGKQRILEKCCPREGTVQALVSGVPMLLDLADVIQRHVFLGYYERAELDIVRKHLPSGGVFVDVGANVGFFSAAASQIVGKTGRVLAIEPTPELIKRLRASFAQGFSHVTVVGEGMGEREGSLRLFVPPARMGNFDPSVVEYCSGMSHIEVSIRTLDAVLEEQGINHVDVLKVDVEGFEPEVIRGASGSLLNRRIAAILIEINEPLLHARSRSGKDIENCLTGFGFGLTKTIDAGGGIRNAFYVLAS